MGRQGPAGAGRQAGGRADVDGVFPDADKANGCGVVICPGGGYSGVCMSYEGVDVAKWFAEHGVAAFVLNYRVSPYGQPIPMLDGQRAVRTVRFNAKLWGVDPKRIGIMGFSAGGHVASTVGTHYDNGIAKTEDPINAVNCRPDFMLLIYPVITMKDKITHPGSKHVLIGDKPPEKLLNLYSNELQVTDETPPTFLVHSVTDDVVPVKNSELFYAALKSHQVPCEFVKLPTGGHGYGMAMNDPAIHVWTDKCLTWMTAQKLFEPAKPVVK